MLKSQVEQLQQQVANATSDNEGLNILVETLQA